MILIGSIIDRSIDPNPSFSKIKKKMLSSSDEEEPAPPPIKMDSWISHVSPPKEPAPDMRGPPSPPMLSLGVKKSTYVRYVFFFFEKKIESLDTKGNHNTHTFTFLLSNSLYYFEFKLNIQTQNDNTNHENGNEK